MWVASVIGSWYCGVAKVRKLESGYKRKMLSWHHPPSTKLNHCAVVPPSPASNVEHIRSPRWKFRWKFQHRVSGQLCVWGAGLTCYAPQWLSFVEGWDVWCYMMRIRAHVSSLPTYWHMLMMSTRPLIRQGKRCGMHTQRSSLGRICYKKTGLITSKLSSHWVIWAVIHCKNQGGAQ